MIQHATSIQPACLTETYERYNCTMQMHNVCPFCDGRVRPLYPVWLARSGSTSRRSEWDESHPIRKNNLFINQLSLNHGTQKIEPNKLPMSISAKRWIYGFQAVPFAHHTRGARLNNGARDPFSTA
eukprot:3939874-Amphidinium_carterae.1